MNEGGKSSRIFLDRARADVLPLRSCLEGRQVLEYKMFQAKHHLSLASVGLALALGACAGASESLLTRSPLVEAPSRVNILVATTRQRSPADAGEMFGGARAENVSYANMVVSIPPDSARTVGAIQKPIALPGNPARDFVIASANFLDKQGFLFRHICDGKGYRAQESLGLCSRLQ